MPNKSFYVTAARLGFGLNVKGRVWAAARDGGVSLHLSGTNFAPLAEAFSDRYCFRNTK